MLKDDAPELIEMGKLHDTIRDLADRIDEDGRDSVANRLTRRICEAAGVSSPMALTADEFNAAAEIFYRERLKREQMGQALDQWSEQVRQLDAMSAWRSGHFNQALFAVLKGRDASSFISTVRSAVIAEELPLAAVTRLIHLMLLTISHMRRQSEVVSVGGMTG